VNASKRVVIQAVGVVDTGFHVQLAASVKRWGVILMLSRHEHKKRLLNSCNTEYVLHPKPNRMCLSEPYIIYKVLNAHIEDQGNQLY
jgi:hypothetical protein